MDLRRSSPCARLGWVLTLAACAVGAALTPAAAEWIDLGGDGTTVTLLESDGGRSVYEITIGGFDAVPVVIDGDTYQIVSLPDEGLLRDAGFPALPVVRRSLIIPDDRDVVARVVESESVELPGMAIAPSKGNLPRTVDPASVPYTFDPIYETASAFPSSGLALDAPHIVRDFRGIVVQANAFQYTPSTRTLRVMTRMRIEVTPAGPARENVLQRTEPLSRMDAQFAKLYENHFLNFALGRYAPVLEEGGILIITYDAFLSEVQPLAEWKLQKGMATELVPLSQVGPTATQIAAYISNAYQSWAPAYVLLVGDGPQIPIPSGGSDPVYSLVAGGDNYPDLFIGRFSAENAAQVQTQVLRTIDYERDHAAGSTWTQDGTGIASNQGPGHYGEYDNQHMDLIRQDLLAYGYFAVDQIYDPTATIAMVSNALNAGRGIVNYCGHGSQTSWGTTGFSNTNVTALTNNGMLPFICSVACNNGTFTGGTCFAEAWLRAANGGTPTGAIACYMSYISQSWDPPMYAEDESIDLLVADEMRTTGGLWFNGSCHMMDMTGSTGAEEFKNWMIFGDPSLHVRTKVAQTMAVSHTGALIIGMSEYAVSVPGVPGALCALYAGGVLYGSAYADLAGNATIAMASPPTQPMTLTLTVTAYNKETAIESVSVLPPSGPYLVFRAAVVQDPEGDNDRTLDEGEIDEIDVTLHNVGVEGATAISAVLTTSDPYVEVQDGTSAYPDLPAGGFGMGDPFVLAVDGSVPDGHLVQITLTVTANEGTWPVAFSLVVHAPVLDAAGCEIDDTGSGNGDGNANPGETIRLVVQVTNTGHSDAEELSGVISSLDPNIAIQQANGQCALIPIDGLGAMGEFEVLILPTCPEPATVNLILAVSDPSGLAVTLPVELPIGGWYDDFEADTGWTVGAPGDAATAGVWTRVDPVGTTNNGHPAQPEDDHTPAPGTLCFITGQGAVGGAAGDSDVDGGKTTLLSPVFDLSQALETRVTYWRWYSNAWGNNPNSDWWRVDVTNDGTTWVNLEETQTTVDAWVEMTFELSEYIALTDHVQLRFVAEDVSPGSLVEAGVDDFLLVKSGTLVAVEDGMVAPARFVLEPNVPNPFNPVTTIGFDLPQRGEVSLAVFDVAGRRVATLARGAFDPGQYRLRWEGLDEAGTPVASGIYFARIDFGGERRVQRMVLVR